MDENEQLKETIVKLKEQLREKDAKLAQSVDEKKALEITMDKAVNEREAKIKTIQKEQQYQEQKNKQQEERLKVLADVQKQLSEAQETIKIH